MNTRLLYLSITGFNVTYHQKLGASREEFLIANGPIMAQCSNFLVIVSQSGAGSPFVYNEVVFVEWMERNLCTILVREEACARESLHLKHIQFRDCGRFFSQGFDFWLPDPNIFLNVPLPYILILSGKGAIFLIIFSQKFFFKKRHFWPVFFLKICLRAKKVVKIGSSK